MPHSYSTKAIKKLALGLSIVIMMNLFFNVGLSVFNPTIDQSEFCPDAMWNDQAVCEEYGGVWVVDENNSEWQYCNETVDCWGLAQDANEPIETLNFIILSGAGVLMLVGGAWLSIPSVVANGMMYGGLLSILIGWIRAAQYLDDLVHFIISGIFLVVLFWVGIKKLKD